MKSNKKSMSEELDIYLEGLLEDSKRLQNEES